jgi:hypothetical protein
MFQHYQADHVRDVYPFRSTNFNPSGNVTPNFQLVDAPTTTKQGSMWTTSVGSATTGNYYGFALAVEASRQITRDMVASFDLAWASSGVFRLGFAIGFRLVSSSPLVQGDLVTIVNDSNKTFCTVPPHIANFASQGLRYNARGRFLANPYDSSGNHVYIGAAMFFQAVTTDAINGMGSIEIRLDEEAPNFFQPLK